MLDFIDGVREEEMLNDKRQVAKTHMNSRKYEEAECLYHEVWSNKGEDWDVWIGWEYASTLKGLGKVDEAISVCKSVYSKQPNFKYNNDLLCWLLYEKYIKPLTKDATAQQIGKVYDIAEFIIKTVSQDGKRTAYESTIFKVIDLLKYQNNFNAKELLKWIDKLDYELLSDEVIKFNLKNGQDKEGASRKESYFSIKTKALEKIGNYEECIKWCDLAFSSLCNLHYDNDIWFAVRRNYCICMTSHGEEFNRAIEEIIECANKKKHWSIYNKIFECYKKRGDYKSAIVYGAKALLSRDPIDKKVTLLLNFGCALEKLEKREWAIKHFEFDLFIRKRFGWLIRGELQEKIKLYNITEPTNINENELQEFWIGVSRVGENILKGKILSIMPHGRSGFIVAEDGNSYFFKKNSIISGHKLLAVGKPVSFRLIDSFDIKKQTKSKEAIDLII